MTTEQQMGYFREQVMPRMSEGGMECFALLGYIRTEDGSMKRVLFTNVGDNPMAEDAMRPVLMFAHMWASAAVHPTSDQDGREP